MENKIEDVVDSLHDLLDEERLALLEGNLEHIERLSERKEILMDDLNSQTAPDIELFSELNTKVQRNQALLKSALAGIQKVADRLAAMRRIKNSLDVYDAKGRRQKIDMQRNRKVEKRA